MKPGDFDDFDLIIPMDLENLADLRALARTPAHAAKPSVSDMLVFRSVDAERPRTPRKS